MLDSSALKDFEAAVGAKYVSDDPAMVRSYAWNTGTGGGQPSERLAPFKPLAVVLPKTTEEVAATVRACLRHGIGFRPQCTGQLTFALVTHDRAIVIDLRRMNTIVELDADNQMAVIEPYVTVGDLMTAAMKKGLTSHAVGAGWTHSPLASATSLFGIGITGHHTSQNVRNLLGWEWVTPTGQIVRGGSPGSGVGWFAGEGPGPGFRGVVRGFVGGMGSLGVFTKIGYKLHPWDGKPEMEHIGQQPSLGLALTPERERVYQCVWTEWDKAIQAVYELTNAKAAQFIVRIAADHYGWTLAETNREYWDQRRTGTLPEIAREENGISWTLMSMSASPAEAAWRDRVIRDIVARSSGRILQLDPVHEAMVARNLVTSSFVARALRGGVCGSITTFGVSDSMSLIPKVVKRGGDLLAPYKQPGGRMTEGDRDQFWIWPNEGRHVWMENICPVNSADDKAMGDGIAYAMETFNANDLDPIGNNGFVYSSEPCDIYGPRGLSNVGAWMRKIKNAFDPHWVADGTYISKKRFPGTTVYPVLRHIMFASHKLLSKMMLGSISGKAPKEGVAVEPIPSAMPAAGIAAAVAADLRLGPADRRPKLDDHQPAGPNAVHAPVERRPEPAATSP